MTLTPSINPQLKDNFKCDKVMEWLEKVPRGYIFNLKFIVCPFNEENSIGIVLLFLLMRSQSNVMTHYEGLI